MQVKLDSYYSIAEVDNLLAALVTAQLLTGPQVTVAEQAGLIQKTSLTFFTVNDLLLPFADKVVWTPIPDGYTHDQEMTTAYARFIDQEVATAYAHFIDRLLLNSPLTDAGASCHLLTVNPDSQGMLVLEGSSLCVGETVIRFDYSPTYPVTVVFAVNELLHSCGVDAGYHALDIDGREGFLLLTHQQYQDLLSNRVLLFKYYDYPEIEERRVAILRAEGLLF